MPEIIFDTPVQRKLEVSAHHSADTGRSMLYRYIVIRATRKLELLFLRAEFATIDPNSRYDPDPPDLP
ncbi:MAG: hypothetical protein ACYCOR_12790 [Acidobacteriaceae bacterium]